MSIHITGGKWKGRALITPRSARVRPTASILRQALFDILGTKAVGSCFLELFAGSGSISFEALSRGASYGCAVENSRDALRALRGNAEQLQCASQLTIYPFEVRKTLRGEKLRPRSFDWLFADPPYEALQSSDATEELLALAGRYLVPGGLCVLERGRRGTEASTPHNEHLEHLNTRRYGDSCLEFWQMPMVRTDA